MNQLPDKLSDCLELALGDLEICERDPRYKIDMGEWHSPLRIDGRCHVCLAGSVLAKTIGIAPTEYSVGNIPDVATKHDSNVIEALDDCRKGHIADAIATMGLKAPPDLDAVEVAQYDDDPARFKSDMRGIVKLLKEAGL